MKFVGKTGDSFVQPRCLSGNKTGMPRLCTWFVLNFILRRHPSLPDESDCQRSTNGVSVSQEKLPTRIRSAGAVYRFVLSLLNNRKVCSFDVIQDVRPPPPPDSEVEAKRAFRGSAFVTLSSVGLVKQLLEDWPWPPGNRPAHVANGVPAPASADVTDARKYGVRVITKCRWEELRDEYLAYRIQLLNTIHEEERKPGATIRSEPGTVEPVLSSSVSDGLSHSAVPQDYPRGCLVFARNIHTETNKTTLRKLFSSAVGFPQDVLDYVDFNKGMNSVSLEYYYSTVIVD